MSELKDYWDQINLGHKSFIDFQQDMHIYFQNKVNYFLHISDVVNLPSDCHETGK